MVTRIIARVLGPALATAEGVSGQGVYIIDGTLLPCWSWKDQTALWSGKYKPAGANLQVVVGLGGRLLWASDPVPGATRDAKAIATSGILEEKSAPPAASRIRAISEPESPSPTRNHPKASSPKPRGRPTSP